MEPLLRFFEKDDNAFSPTLREMAKAIVEQLPRNTERTIALRKLLEVREAVGRTLEMGEVSR